MSKTQSALDAIQQIVSYGKQKKIVHLYTDINKKIKGNAIFLEGKEVVNFGSCSYLGLEFDDRLKEASKQAIDDFGTQFSESRAYVSISLYKELEELFEKIFDSPVVITQTTTLGHIAALPVLVSCEDCIIMDHQVHNSVQTAVNLVKSQGVTVELLRHNRMDLLEERVKYLRSKYKKIWYMADGIYSMYGDVSPVKEIYALMDKYPELNYYVDDAHGMSIYGKHGRGYVLDQMPIHKRAIVATSLVKAFPTGGAVLIFPTKEQAHLVRSCGSTLITSGPMQPSQLGAATAAAKIHLTEEIYEMQNDLQDNIRFANSMLKKYKLPVIAPSNAAVFFIGVSLPKLGHNMVHRMLNKGFYVNLGIFPAVPMKNTGVRFTITKLHTFSQIENMIATLAMELPMAMLEEDIALRDIYKAFKLQMPEDILLDKSVSNIINQSLFLKLQHYDCITKVDKTQWNKLFEGKGTFDWDALQLLQKSFSDNKLRENNWKFDYVLIKDNDGEPVVATFLTTTLWKDDMQSPASVSAKVEQERLTDSYFLTSTVISTGSLLTEGEHIFINKKSPYWKEAMKLLFEKIYHLQEENKASNIVLRDFCGEDEELDTFFVDNGFFKIAMPENNIVQNMDWSNREDFYKTLSQRSRQHFREDIKKHENKFDVKVETLYSKENIDYWYSLYLNVKSNSLDLNTFTLPKKAFEQMLESDKWEVLSLTVKKQFDFIGIEKPVAIVFSYKINDSYMPMIMGLDYSYHKEYKTYRQALFQLVLRGKELGCTQVNLGFSASVEKKKVNALPVVTYGYMQAKDSYNFQVLANMSLNANK
jgi:7-keto-8-aminopelargonate synthetase-like enzyme/predicted N-acyltransferase